MQPSNPVEIQFRLHPAPRGPKSGRKREEQAPAAAPVPGRLPRITQLLALAIQLDIDGRRQREAAERYSANSFDYSLSDLGLEAGSGQPNADGRTLRAFLRSGGELVRSGDDISVLRLAQRLREWSGMESEPFQFGRGDQSWVALFDCGSERMR